MTKTIKMILNTNNVNDMTVAFAEHTKQVAFGLGMMSFVWEINDGDNEDLIMAEVREIASIATDGDCHMTVYDGNEFVSYDTMRLW